MNNFNQCNGLHISPLFLAAFLLCASPFLLAKEAPWQKLQTTDIKLRHESQIFSPGLFDTDLQQKILFPGDGSAFEFNLPHEGKDAKGNPLPPLKGIMKGDFLWLDLNGDGSQSSDEIRGFKKAGESLGPFVYHASYQDGTSAPYTFKLVYTGKPGQFKILRCNAKQVKIGTTQLLLLDDNGNGRFNDLGRDALIVNDQPVTFLSRQIFIDGKLHELLVHPAGQTLEIKRLAKVQMGKVNLFLLYKPAQKSESLKIHTLIIRGRDGAFSFDRKRPEAEVPVGAYDLVFGLFSRAKEMMILKSGERTSFSVETGKLASPQWGSPITGTLKIGQDGQLISVEAPEFTGAGSEIYRPVDWGKISMYGVKFLVWRDKTLNGVERFEQQASKRFTISPDGLPQPITFEHFRSDELHFKVTYPSGILGTVLSEKRVSFIHKRR